MFSDQENTTPKAVSSNHRLPLSEYEKFSQYVLTRRRMKAKQAWSKSTTVEQVQCHSEPVGVACPCQAALPVCTMAMIMRSALRDANVADMEQSIFDHRQMFCTLPAAEVVLLAHCTVNSAGAISYS